MLGIPVEPIASLKKTQMPIAPPPEDTENDVNPRHSRFPSDPPAESTPKANTKKQKADPPARSELTAIHVDDDEQSDQGSVWSVSSGETSSARPRAHQDPAQDKEARKAERKKAKRAERKARKRAETMAAVAAAQQAADDDDMEDGEIVETSVGSLDSLEEQGFKELAEQAGIEREESDSRYALAKSSGPSRKRTKPNPPAKAAKTYVESDGDSSDSSILPPPTPSSRKTSANQSPAPSDMSKKQLKAARRIEEQTKAKINAIARKSRETSASASRSVRSGTVDSFHEDDDTGTPLSRGTTPTATAAQPIKIRGAAKKAREAVDSKRKFWAAKADMGGVPERDESDDFQDGVDFIAL